MTGRSRGKPPGHFAIAAGAANSPVAPIANRVAHRAAARPSGPAADLHAAAEALSIGLSAAH